MGIIGMHEKGLGTKEWQFMLYSRIKTVSYVSPFH